MNKQILVFYSCFLTMIVFGQITDPQVHLLGSGSGYFEGPVWRGDSLLFSAVSGSTIYKWTETGGITTFLAPSDNSNGLVYDNNGDLVIAQHGTRQLARMQTDGNITPIASEYDGNLLNSPNDLALYSDGTLFFTDPYHGLTNPSTQSELGYTGVFSLTTEGTVHLLDSTLENPNGIAFSPDFSKLYIGTSGGTLFVFDVENNTTISNKQELITDRGYCDGMCVDPEGFIYQTNTEGISIINPDNGTVVNTIVFDNQPEGPIKTTNCTWGGSDGRTLFVTANVESGSWPGYLYRVTGIFPVSSEEIKYSDNLDHIHSPYPNPFSNKLNIDFTLSGNEEIGVHVYNFNGVQVSNIAKSYSKGIHSFSLNTTDYNNGLYMVLINIDGTGQESYTLLKAN